MKSLIQSLLDAAIRGLKPPVQMTVSEWADEYRFLSPEASAEPGRWRTDRAPYQRGIMDAVKTHAQVVIKSSAQIGKTEIINNVLGFIMHTDPSPIMILQPTVEMAETWSKDRLKPMLRDTPAIRDLVNTKSRDSNNTILHKVFPGGHLTAAGANSAASLASRPIRVLLCDEVDRYPASAGDEGDPVSLAKKRTATFWNRRLIYVSTPTVRGQSRISILFENSDQRYFYVPCPHCGEFQTLNWARMKWDKTELGEHLPSTARMECEHCEAEIPEKFKWQMLKRGHWKSQSNSNMAGFHISALYSPWAKWAELVDEFLTAKSSGSEMMKVWVNTVLGEEWEDADEKSLVQDHQFSSQCDFDPKEMPASAYAITAGVDVQKDRLQVEIVAWGEGEESWSLDYVTIQGSPSLASTWSMLDDQLDRVWRNENGIFGILCCCIDSGGHHTDEVYSFTKQRELRRVFSIKGQSQQGKALVGRPSTSNKARVKLFPVGTDTAKELIYGRIMIENPGTGYMHFPFERDLEFFKELTGEKPITAYKNGHPFTKWVKNRPRNEALDCRVYATAALKILNPAWEELKRRYAPDLKSTEKAVSHNSGNELAAMRRKTVPRRKRNFANSWKR